MQPETNGVNTNTWLEASKDIKIRAYIENYMPTFNMVDKPNQYLGFYDSLREISVPFPIRPAINLEPYLDLELMAWDSLSDEALFDFEQGL